MWTKCPIRASQITLQMSADCFVAWKEHPSHLNKSTTLEYLDFKLSRHRVPPQETPTGMLAFCWLTQRALITTRRMSRKCSRSLSGLFSGYIAVWGMSLKCQFCFSRKLRATITTVFIEWHALFSIPTKIIPKQHCWYSKWNALQSSGCTVNAILSTTHTSQDVRLFLLCLSSGHNLTTRYHNSQ